MLCYALLSQSFNINLLVTTWSWPQLFLPTITPRTNQWWIFALGNTIL